MLQNTKCECGHQNAVGTVLCESCGKPLFDEDGDASPLEMRYDGVARRSQKADPKLIDRIWNFFSSVRNAVIMILVLLVGSILGTVYPQENTFINVDPAEFYPKTFGTAGKIYYMLGLSHTYSSWWFKLLLVMIGASLVICSLDRVLPLYRALSKQQLRKHPGFLQRQRVTFSTALPAGSADDWMSGFALQLRKRRYRVHREDGALLAEKNRFSRWGPYINHIGLILVLLAVLMRGIPGWYMDQYIGFVEGVPTPIPETPYYLENQQFTVEYYEDKELPKQFQGQGRLMPKLYRTKAVLYRCTADCDDPAKASLVQVDKHDIEVNDPLVYKGLSAYQFDYRSNPMILAADVGLYGKADGKKYGTLHLDMRNPAETYDAGLYHLVLRGYYPDFALDDKGNPSTKGRDPLAPAFIFVITGPGLPSDGSVYIYFARQIDKVQFSQDKLNGELANKLDIHAESMQNIRLAQYTSYLNIRKDRAVPYVFFGAIIFMIGVVMGLYWQHRRIWLRVDDGALLLGAHTNKNWYGLRKEVSSAMQETGLAVEPKQLENEVRKS